MRFGLSAVEKRDVWRRWKAGETLHEIGRVFDKPHSCIRSVLLPRGGIPPIARRRSRLALTLAEREDISRAIASGSSIRESARVLGRAVSTVSREIIRHGGRPAYRAHDADQQAWNAALRPKRCLLAVNCRLRDIVASKLILDWSPEQISGWLKTRYPNNESMHVSHETIYRSLFIQARGVLKKELMETCESGRPRDSWSFGRGSAGWWKEQLYRDVSGAAFTLSHANQGADLSLAESVVLFPRAHPIPFLKQTFCAQVAPKFCAKAKTMF